MLSALDVLKVYHVINNLNQTILHCKKSITNHGDLLTLGNKVKIYVKDYADAKFGCVPVAQPKTCHCGPRELPGRGTKKDFQPFYVFSSLLSIPSLQSPTYTLPCPMVASLGLCNRDIHNFSACVMSDADESETTKDVCLFPPMHHTHSKFNLYLFHLGKNIKLDS